MGIAESRLHFVFVCPYFLAVEPRRDSFVIFVVIFVDEVSSLLIDGFTVQP